ncbi:hypothetical protein Aph01nite_05600 [Acrocarpospora phusangensis]|uniref:CARDB domain-containing protein n=2 Tax=Acrocarpospora phusangensis TaxID=1070424 RepID=A0A919UN08_9ACTN|nr:hypothetical protein Aph01nite_05600 [Acrocarpospora phusangensis]
MKIRLIVPLVGVLSVLLAGLPATGAAAEECARVGFIGVKGSGEDPDPEDNAHRNMGAPVHRLAEVLAERLGENLWVEFYPGIDYPAVTVQELGEQFRETPGTADSVVSGQIALLAKLNEITETCPDQQFVLAGYSQGAMVIKNALNGLNPTGPMAKRIKAVVLYSDPLPNIKNGVVRGVFPKLFSLAPTEFPSAIRHKIHCNPGDSVCGKVSNTCTLKVLDAMNATPLDAPQKWNDAWAACTEAHHTYESNADEAADWLSGILLNTDLAVTGYKYLTPKPVCAGSNPAVQLEIKNKGKLDSGTYDIRWIVDGDPLDHYLPSIPEGGTGHAELHYHGIPQGTHTITFIVDPGERLVETKEDNNRKDINVVAKAC